MRGDVPEAGLGRRDEAYRWDGRRGEIERERSVKVA